MGCMEPHQEGFFVREPAALDSWPGPEPAWRALPAMPQCGYAKSAARRPSSTRQRMMRRGLFRDST